MQRDTICILPQKTLTLMKLAKILSLAVCVHACGILNAWAFDEEAINKNLWLNTGGSLGALPGQKSKNPDATPKRYQYDSSIWDEFEYEYEDSNISQFPFYMETEITSVSPTEDMLYDTSVDMIGFNLKFGIERSLSDNFSYDLYWLSGYSYGEGEYSGSSGWRDYWSEYGVWFVETSLGINIHWHIGNHFSVYAGARIGGSMLYVEDANYDSEAGFGFAYGVGAGIQWKFNEHHAMTLGYAFVGSTAESEINTYGGENVTVEKQKFNMFSLGYKYTF